MDTIGSIANTILVLHLSPYPAQSETSEHDMDFP